MNINFEFALLTTWFRGRV